MIAVLTFDNTILGGTTMERNILSYLSCPARTLRCSPHLRDAEETLSCDCGRKYKKINGFPALRTIDELYTLGLSKRLKQDDRYEKYDNELFVGMFLCRQYGHLLGDQKDFASRTSEKVTATLYKDGGLFYKSLVDMALSYLRDDLVILDLGCGTGRLTGEFSQRAKYAIGMDYSPSMLDAAKRVILGKKGKTVNFKIRSSRLEVYEMATPAWGIRNCAFVIGDAQIIPLAEGMVDFLSCVNLLHRVANPGKVIQEIKRSLKKDGVLLVSNSYDWDIRYTPKELWFDNFSEELNPNDWRMERELDGVPCIVRTYNRELSIKFNHIQTFRKLS